MKARDVHPSPHIAMEVNFEMATTIVLNPISFPPPPVAIENTHLMDLAGKSIGFLSNNKPNADVLLKRLAERLHDRFGIVAEHYNKGIPSLEAPRELLDQVCKNCQGVVLAVCD
jgi:hypothetical protein